MTIGSSDGSQYEDSTQATMAHVAGDGYVIPGVDNVLSSGQDKSLASSKSAGYTLSVQPSKTPPVEVANQTLSSPAKALLDTIAGSESPGYDVRYGGKKITDYSQFPAGGATITSGPNQGLTSSASGRYQFIRSTWNQQATKLGLTDFSPESQDAAAWDLAQTAYSRRYKGRDLEQDIQNPHLYSNIARALSGEWSSLPGGIETNRAGRQFAQNLTANLSKHQAAEAAQIQPSDEAGAPQQVAGDVVPLPMYPGLDMDRRQGIERMKTKIKQDNPGVSDDHINRAFDRYFGGPAKIIPGPGYTS